MRTLTLTTVFLCLVAFASTSEGVTFGIPYPVSIDTDRTIGGPCLSLDELTVYFHLEHGEGDSRDLFYATRTDTSSSFGAPIPIASLNTSYGESSPHISADGLRLYYNCGSLPGVNESIYLATRATVGDAFGSPTLVAELSTEDYIDGNPSLTADELTIIFSSTRPGIEGKSDLFMATRNSVNDPFDAPVNLSYISSPDFHQYSPSISADGLTIFWVQRDNWIDPGSEIWMATRPDLYSTFGDVHPVDELNISGVNLNSPAYNYSQTFIYFGSPDKPGAEQGCFWVAEIVPEPGTMAMGISAILTGLLFCRKWKRESE